MELALPAEPADAGSPPVVAPIPTTVVLRDSTPPRP
jgi:hypothetical protein